MGVSTGSDGQDTRVPPPRAFVSLALHPIPTPLGVRVLRGVPGSDAAHRSSEPQECRVLGPGTRRPMPGVRTVRGLGRPTKRHGMTISTPRSAESHDLVL